MQRNDCKRAKSKEEDKIGTVMQFITSFIEKLGCRGWEGREKLCIMELNIKVCNVCTYI